MIARNVGADVEIVRERRQTGVADVGAGDQWARPGVALTIEEKIRGRWGRENADIGLYEARRDAGRVTGIRALADCLPCRARIPTVPGLAPQLAALPCYT